MPLTVNLVLTNPFQILIPATHCFTHVLLLAVSSDEEIEIVDNLRLVGHLAIDQIPQYALPNSWG
jgi:hypothetical protein